MDPRRRRITDAVAIALVFLSTPAVWISLRSVFEPLELQTVDRLFQLRQRWPSLRPRLDESLAVVQIDDATFRELGRRFLTREDDARVLAQLTLMDTNAQVFDAVYPSRETSPGDTALATAARASSHAYFGISLRISAGATTPGAETQDPAPPAAALRGEDSDLGSIPTGTDPIFSFPELAHAARGNGHLALAPDRDGVIRRVPLFVRHGGVLHPGLALRVASDMLGVPLERIVIRPGDSVVLPGAHRPGTAHARDLVIPVDAACNVLVNFPDRWFDQAAFPYAAVMQATELDLPVWRTRLKGRTVIVADASTQGKDLGPTPLAPTEPRAWVHVSVLNSLLTGQFLRTTSRAESALLQVATAAAMMLFAAWGGSYRLLLGTALTLAGLAGVASLAFIERALVTNVTLPALSTLFALFVTLFRRYLDEERQRAYLRRTFETYFPPAVVRRLARDPERFASISERKELTVLFSDIKNFTGLSSTLEPAAIRESLNAYFDAMVEIVFRHGGTVDKFIGDGLMVFFGDPDPQPDHAERAVRAALEMQSALATLRPEWHARGLIPVRLRIGISTGWVVVGNMGSMRRLSYTVLGASVNLAQRLEANAPVDGILISARTQELVRDRIAVHPGVAIRIKGFEDLIVTHEVAMSARLDRANSP